MDFQQLAQVVGQVGLPIALIAFGMWFAAVKFWPWYSDESRRSQDRAVDMAQAEALKALAVALETVSLAGRDKPA